MPERTIMVIDDEPNTLELTKAVLEMNGFNVTTFDIAQKALDALKEQKPDLILLDMRMPQISGIDFCKKTKETLGLKNLKIIFFTASSNNDKDTLNKTGALGYLFKPFDNDDLVKQVNKYLDIELIN